MASLKLLKMAWRNSTRHLRYTLGAVLIVATGFLALTLFRLYIVDVSRIVEATWERRLMYGHVLVEKKAEAIARLKNPWRYLLSVTDQKVIETYLQQSTNHRIRRRVRFLTGNGLISNGLTQTIVWAKGYDTLKGAELRGDVWDWDAVAGLPLDIAQGPARVSLGKGLAETMGCLFNKEPPRVAGGLGYVAEPRPLVCPLAPIQISVTTESGRLNLQRLEVTGVTDGIFRELDSRYALLPLESMQKLYGTKSISYYVVELNDKRMSKAFLTAFNHWAKDHHLDIEAELWESHNDGDLYRRTMQIFNLFETYIVTIMGLIIGLAVFSAFVKSVSERAREIGTLRSLGFRRRAVLELFVYEAALVGIIASVIGGLTSLAITPLMNALSIQYQVGGLTEPVPFRFAYDFGVYLSTTVFILVVVIGSALAAVLAKVRAVIPDNLLHV